MKTQEFIERAKRHAGATLNTHHNLSDICASLLLDSVIELRKQLQGACVITAELHDHGNARPFLVVRHRSGSSIVWQLNRCRLDFLLDTSCDVSSGAGRALCPCETF